LTEINWGPTGKLVYERTYSRTKPDGTKETWPETVQRVVDGNLALVPPHRHLPNERERLIELITDFKVLPAGRHLWASGVPGRQYLFNCVSGDTMIHTASGLVPIRELVGRTVDILSQDATYRPATFYHYGDQEIYTVTLSNGEVIEATAGHEWVTYNSGAFYRHTTTELLGKRVPLNVAPRPEEDEDYRRGVAWGMVYGDGTVTSTKKASLALFGPKVALAAYVEGFGTSTAVHDKRRTDDNVRVNGLPIEWKLTLPELTASRSLWRGFIAGLIATDGHVNGNVTLYSSDRDALAHIAKGAAYAGIPPRRIRMVREFSPFDGSRKPCYALGLTKWALTPQDILREDHLEKIKFPPKASVHTLRVIDVKATGRIERVYCCTEEETHTMTVGSGILTGQCHVAGWGDSITDHFRFTFLRLMEGGGVGANYSNDYLMRYLKVKNRLKVHIVCDPSHPDYEKMRQAGVLSDEYDADWAGAYPIEDSREGWADALADLLGTYYREDVRHENRVYDVSRVRPEGARLRTFGGRASGPLPLAVMLHEVSEVMNRSCGRPLFGMDAMEIDHAIAKCVVSGGNRRSARMSIMAWDDPEIDIFLGCKEETGKHWTTNISVEINDRFFEALEDPEGSALRDIAERVLQRIAEGMLRNGEPGIWNSSYANIGEPNPVIATNPCVTSDTWVMTTEGARQVADLIGKPFTAVVDGKPYATLSEGFFLTGRKPTVELVTRDGYAVTLTADHRVKTPGGWKPAGELRPGDKVVLSDHEGIAAWGGSGTEGQGYLLGRLVGDGTFYPDGSAALTRLAAEYGVVRGNKTVTPEVERASSDFYRGFLRGVFDTDGHIEGRSTDSGISIRLTWADLDGLRAIQRMLARLGIRSVIRDCHPEGRSSFEEYASKASYRLIVSGANAARFMREIGFLDSRKAARWEELARDMKRDFYHKPCVAVVDSVRPGEERPVYDVTVADVHAFDGNGIVLHNCGEIALEPWENCNLGHVNLARFVDSEGNVDYAGIAEAHRLITRFLIRATYGDVNDPKQAEVLARNRRIGVGHLGVASYLAKIGVRYSEAADNPGLAHDLECWAHEVEDEATRYAHQLRIPVPVKMRTVAPTGTIAKLSGDSEGIHPIFGKWFIRRIRLSTVDPEQWQTAVEYAAQGYHVEDCQYAPNTVVIEIPTEDTLIGQVAEIHGREKAEEIVQCAADLTLEDMLKVQRLYQTYWADNAVSCTANIDPEKYTVEDIKQVIREFGPELKGMTIFPEKGMPQAPYERISKDEYESASAKTTADSIDENCASGACPVR